MSNISPIRLPTILALRTGDNNYYLFLGTDVDTSDSTIYQKVKSLVKDIIKPTTPSKIQKNVSIASLGTSNYLNSEGYFNLKSFDLALASDSTINISTVRNFTDKEFKVSKDQIKDENNLQYEGIYKNETESSIINSTFKVKYVFPENVSLDTIYNTINSASGVANVKQDDDKKLVNGYSSIGLKIAATTDKSYFKGATNLYNENLINGIPLKIASNKKSDDKFAWARITNGSYSDLQNGISFENCLGFSISSKFMNSDLYESAEKSNNKVIAYNYYESDDGNTCQKVSYGEILFQITFYRKDTSTDSSNIKGSNLYKSNNKTTVYIIAAEPIKLYKLLSIYGLSKNFSGITEDSKALTNGILYHFSSDDSKLVNGYEVLTSLINKGIIIGNAEPRDYSDVANDLITKVNNTIKKYTVFSGDTSNNNLKALVDEETSTSPTKLNIESYYDTMAGMTPWVQVKLRNGSEENSYITYDSNKCPFIRSMSISDNGVKKLTLEMWDKDFGSYYYDSDGNKKISLERNIQKAIQFGNTSSSKINTMTISKEGDETSQANSGSLLDIYKETGNTSMTNLKLRFGYNDYNPPSSELTEKYNTYVGNNGRTNRYWEMESPGTPEVTGKIFNVWKDSSSTNSNTVKQISGLNTNFPSAFGTDENKEYIVDANIGWLNGVGLEAAEKAEKADGINRYKQVISSSNSVTSKTEELDFMITGYSSKLTQDGIVYTIEAIEIKNTDTLNYSIVQRYEQINNTPKLVLYTLMRLFNETKDGKLVANAPKIYWADPNDIYEEEETEEADADVIDGLNSEATKESKIKKITISLGGQNAYYNYHQNDTATPHFISYKSIASLMNEFCAACPPIKDGVDPTTVTINGETVEIENTAQSSVRPLTWTTGTVEVDGKNQTCIFLHYKKPLAVEKIRKYCWGPGNTVPSCIKELSIENKNEFAVISGVNSLVLDSKSKNNNDYVATFANYINNNNTDQAKLLIKRKVQSLSSVTNRITDSLGGNNMSQAYSNAMFEGKITLLGDPFYSFDNIMVPFNYPIYLDIKVPVSEADTKERNSVGAKDDDSELLFGREGMDTNNLTRTHILSGYYVVKSIEHSISTSGYETVLGIMSYPGLAYQLKDEKASKAAEKSVNDFLKALGLENSVTSTTKTS